MKAVTKIVFLDEKGEKFFGEGPARLLRGISATGSLRAAAMSMDMAYSKAMKLMKQAEEALGYPLIRRTTGGKGGGGSCLTQEGLAWLNQYEAYRDACIRANEALYRAHFPDKTGCVIMASGLGQRFGGNKLMADFQGQPLICRILDATEGLFFQRVVVTRHEDVAELCRRRQIPVVLHEMPYRSDTVRLGLEALGDVERCMFCPGDQPLLTKATIEALLAAAGEQPRRIWRTACQGTPGSPVVFPKWAFPELTQLPQGKGGGWVISTHQEKVSLLEVSDPRELMDADTPEALETLARKGSL